MDDPTLEPPSHRWSREKRENTEYLDNAEPYRLRLGRFRPWAGYLHLPMVVVVLPWFRLPLPAFVIGLTVFACASISAFLMIMVEIRFRITGFIINHAQARLEWLNAGRSSVYPEEAEKPLPILEMRSGEVVGDSAAAYLAGTAFGMGGLVVGLLLVQDRLGDGHLVEYLVAVVGATLLYVGVTSWLFCRFDVALRDRLTRLSSEVS